MGTMHQPNPGEEHPSNAELVELVEGRLSASARGALEVHLAGCDGCAAVVDGLASEEEREALRASDRLDLGTAQAILGEPTSTWIDGAGEPGARRAAATLARGTLFGRYLVLSLIGRGGMGEVYAAYDPELDRRVALKRLTTRQDTQRARARLLREARALGKLSHPNVVQVYDVGEHDGDVFVAMELVEGQPFGAFCAGPPRPGWREVLAAYRDAARGLAAAHAQGIVHRDVKPANILRGNDGRVRVADFGLAAGRWQAGEGGDAGTPPDLSETAPGRSDASGERDGRLTATGTLLGTPLYMAPEQFEGPGVGPASDQHSLCTALHEGLYGALPFSLPAGPTAMSRLVALKKEGPPRAPPPGSPVPPSIYRAIARGLAPDPAARFPSMDALLEALREDPPERRTRLRNAAIGAALLLATAGAAAALGARSGALRDPCAHPERQLAGTWDEGVSARVRAALLGAGGSNAEGTAARVSALLDRRGADWAAMRREVCLAGSGDPHRREILALRDACLDRRRGQLQALTTLLAEKPDPGVLDKAVAATAGLAPIASCADTEALTARVRPPEDPALSAQVAAVEPGADRLETLYATGKYRDGLALGERLLAEATAIPYPPLRARISYWMGRLEESTADFPHARALLEDAAASATEGRDDLLAAAAWAELLFVVGDDQRRFEEASVIRTLGQGVVARTRDEQTQAVWLRVEGAVLFRMGKSAEARSIQERAVVLSEKALGADHPEVASALNNLANTIFTLGDYPTSLATHERALAISENALGPDHPHVAISLNNLGELLYVMGDYPRALAAYQRSLALREKALPPDHHYLAESSFDLGNALFKLGHLAGASSSYERALAIWEKASNPDALYALVSLARVKVSAGQLDAARSLLERASALGAKPLAASDPNVAELVLGLGELELARREPSSAVPLLERALTLHDPNLEAEIQLTLAEALWQVGRDRPRARTLAEQARSRYQRIGHRPGVDRATHWLEGHPL